MNDLPATETHPDNHAGTISRNARYGLILFAIYVAFYLGFMLLTAISPTSMATPISAFGGVNLAIVYGFGLIVLALLLALVYMVLCRPMKE
jgi:uncharacterized membrane protein (DUF485 family)